MSEDTRDVVAAPEDEITIRLKGGTVEAYRGGRPVELSASSRAQLAELDERERVAAGDRRGSSDVLAGDADGNGAVFGGSEPSDARRRDALALVGEGEEEEFEPWADQLYCAMVKNARKQAGYGTAQAFSDSIYRRTRLRIGRDTLYKIEQGRQMPDIRQFMAINLTLYHAPFPTKVVKQCMCREWFEIAANEGEIPMAWRKRNTLDLEESTGERFYTGAEAARVAHDDPNLFGYGTAPEPR